MMNVNKELYNYDVVFVSAVCPPGGPATSTDIMTNNIIHGIKENGKSILLLAVCKKEDDVESIKNYYSNKVDKVIILRSFFEKKPNPLEYLLTLIKMSSFLLPYEKELKKKLGFVLIPGVIISNMVYFDEIGYTRVLKKIYESTPYYQYWSDPMTLSGITPHILRKKLERWPFYFVERRAISKADRVIYGTEPLMNVQKKLFHSYASKMYYVDISYTINDSNSDPISNNPINKPTQCKRFLYAGNYYKSIRNIIPLMNAVSKTEGVTLDIYGNGDTVIVESENIIYHKRISAEKMLKVEKEFDCSICILNHSCIQIPGKIFYSLMNRTPILVIADGFYSEKIVYYLNKYRRFVLCSNNKESIIEALYDLKSKVVDYCYIEKNYSPKKIACDLINGGLNNE